MTEHLVAALYKFVPLDDIRDLQPRLLEKCNGEGVFGTILLAPEGINGTIAGSPAGVRSVLAWLRADDRLADLQHKESTAADMPFYRMKVRLKSEIVTMGIPGLDPQKEAGTYVAPEDWNDLIRDPDVVVVDTRNDYEVSIGTFEGAVNPGTASFREFPAWADGASELREKRKVAMFCTGGIRCEKATAYLKRQGFGEVYHLDGGILKYLETVPEAESLWRGDCFVFDQRVSVSHGLEPGHYDMCHACRRPVSAQDKARPEYVPGVSCPHCHDASDERQKERYAARQRQMELAETRRTAHLGQRLAKAGTGDAG